MALSVLVAVVSNTVVSGCVSICSGSWLVALSVLVVVVSNTVVSGSVSIGSGS